MEYNNKQQASINASIVNNKQCEVTDYIVNGGEQVNKASNKLSGKRVNKDNPLVKPRKLPIKDRHKQEQYDKQFSMLDNPDHEYRDTDGPATTTQDNKPLKQYDSDATIQAQDFHLKKHYDDKPVRQFVATDMMNAAIDANTYSTLETEIDVDPEMNDMMKTAGIEVVEPEIKETVFNPLLVKEVDTTTIDGGIIEKHMDDLSRVAKETYNRKAEEDMLDAFMYANQNKHLKTEEIFKNNPVYNRLSDRMKQQIRKGVDKYNTPNGVETSDYSVIGWYEHLQEELVDGSTYNEIMLMKINMVIKTLQVASRMNDLSLLKDHVAIALELLEGNGKNK